MPSPDSPLGYLRRVLRDGQRPYFYRSRVRRLLGLPENGAEVAYAAATLPPVGFRYLEQPWLAVGIPAGHLPDRLRFEDRPPAPGESPRPEGGDVAAPAAPEALAPSSPHQDPATPARRNRIAIPGVSATRQHFPALAEVEPTPSEPVPETRPPKRKPGDERPSPVVSVSDEPSSKATGPPSVDRREVPPKSPSETRREETPGSSGGRGSEPLQARLPAPKERPQPLRDGGPAATAQPAAPALAEAQAPSVVRPAAPRPPAPGGPPGDLRTAPEEAAFVGQIRPNPLSQRGAKSRLSPAPPLDERGDRGGSPADEVGRMPQLAVCGPPSRVTPPGRRREAEAVDKRIPEEGLEKIRQAVYRLASKAAPRPAYESPSEPWATEPPKSAPRAPRPAPAVVVRTPPPSRTPDAFWERSYLNHSLLRTLR